MFYEWNVKNWIEWSTVAFQFCRERKKEKKKICPENLTSEYYYQSFIALSDQSRIVATIIINYTAIPFRTNPFLENGELSFILKIRKWCWSIRLQSVWCSNQSPYNLYMYVKHLRAPKIYVRIFYNAILVVPTLLIPISSIFLLFSFPLLCFVFFLKERFLGILSIGFREVWRSPRAEDKSSSCH